MHQVENCLSVVLRCDQSVACTSTGLPCISISEVTISPDVPIHYNVDAYTFTCTVSIESATTKLVSSTGYGFRGEVLQIRIHSWDPLVHGKVLLILKDLSTSIIFVPVSSMVKRYVRHSRDGLAAALWINELTGQKIFHFVDGYVA